MGNEWGQRNEWWEDVPLDWELLSEEEHRHTQRYVRRLCHLVRKEKALSEGDCEPGGFEWIDPDNADDGVITFIRRSLSSDQYLLVVCNFTPVLRPMYRIGVTEMRMYQEVLNSNHPKYGGAGALKSQARWAAESVAWNRRPYSLVMPIPPLAIVILKPGKRIIPSITTS